MKALLIAGALLMATPALSQSSIDVDGQSVSRFDVARQPGQEWLVERFVEFWKITTRCPAVKATEKSKFYWTSLIQSYTHTTPDVPLLKAYLRTRIKTEAPISWPDRGGKTYCQAVMEKFGEVGRERQNYIVMKDGSSALPKCFHDGSCLEANRTTIYFD